MVQLVKFLLHKREGPELSYLVPTLKERKTMGMDKWREGGRGGMEGWMDQEGEEGKEGGWPSQECCCASIIPMLGKQKPGDI